jgi:hypothetical protein
MIPKASAGHSGSVPSSLALTTRTRHVKRPLDLGQRAMTTKTNKPTTPLHLETGAEGGAVAAPHVTPVSAPSNQAVDDFIAKIKSLPTVPAGGRGRLIFAMDATMSRQPTWDMALSLQSDMFNAVRDVGGLDVQLVYFRGLGECRSSAWVSKADELARVMRQVNCRGGLTQIERVLRHATAEARAKRINAVVYVGDCMEEEADQLCARAGELAVFGVPVFLFQEGHNAAATATFKEIARITRGAVCRFDAGSAKQLRDLLTAVAVYAAGGHAALSKLSGTPGGAGAHLLLTQLKR